MLQQANKHHLQRILQSINWFCRILFRKFFERSCQRFRSLCQRKLGSYRKKGLYI